MSEIKVNCPQCKNVVMLHTAELNRTQGRASCPSCDFVFHLVKKSKKKAEIPAPPVETPAPTPRNESAATVHEHDALMGKKPKKPAFSDEDIRKMFEDFADVDDSDPPLPPPEPEPKAAAQHNRRPLSYRIPKAGKPFADERQPFTFMLLDRDNINAQLPQVAVKEKAAKQPAPSALRQDGQQNNITIHTDSLVFTLIGDGQNTNANSMGAGQTGTSARTETAPAAAVQSGTVITTSDLNWTVATLSALIVLIVQLFYWVMMMM